MKQGPKKFQQVKRVRTHVGFSVSFGADDYKECSRHNSFLTRVLPISVKEG